MRALVFASRNGRELLRDPVSLAFGVGLPVVLLLLMQLIQRSTGSVVEIFNLERFAPGIALFSLAFLSMFAAMLMAGDRDTSFLARLFAAPMTAADFIGGYCLPLLPLALAQGLVCFGVAVLLGLRLTVGILWCLLAMLPGAMLFISFGLFMGTVLRYRQVGPIASILVQVAALSSGMWFDLDLIGGAFRTICRVLPFSRALELMQRALLGSYAGSAANISWVLCYTVLLTTATIYLFRRQMRK